MKKLTYSAVILLAACLLFSCARSISTYEAANGKAKCGRTIR